MWSVRSRPDKDIFKPETIDEAPMLYALKYRVFLRENALAHGLGVSFPGTAPAASGVESKAERCGRDNSW